MAEMTWTAGSWSGVVAPGGLALLEPSAPAEVVAGLWSALHQQTPEITALLDCFIASCGRLADIPGFALVVPGADGVRVALRGDAELTANGERIRAGEVTTWVEATLTNVADLSLAAPGGGSQPQAVLTMALDGGTGAGPVRGAASQQEDPQDGADAVGQSQEQPGPVLGDHDGWTVASLPEELTGELRRLMDQEPVAAPPTSQGSGDQVDWGIWEAAVSLTRGATPQDPWTEEDQAAAVAGSTAQSARAEQAPTEEPPAQDVEAQSAREAPDEQAPEEDSRQSSDVEPTVEVGSVWDLPGGSGPADGAQWAGGQEQSAAWDLGASAASAEQAPEATEDGSGPAGQQEPVRQALSVLCPNGHTNPTNRIQCRVCGAILLDSARLMDCPSLGRVRVGEGETIELDRSVLIGRQPSVDAVPRYEGAAPHLVTIDDPEQLISRSHLLIILDEWSVLASNLSAGNGTTLRRQGTSPTRLTSPDPVLLRSGDVLDLGGGHTIVLEDLP